MTATNSIQFTIAGEIATLVQQIVAYVHEAVECTDFSLDDGQQQHDIDKHNLYLVDLSALQMQFFAGDLRAARWVFDMRCDCDLKQLIHDTCPTLHGFLWG